MKATAYILFAIAAAAATTPAMRADDLSDLVAAVAADHSAMQNLHNRDFLTMKKDTLPIYKPSRKNSNANIELSLLDGIAGAMHEEMSQLDFIIGCIGSFSERDEKSDFKFGHRYIPQRNYEMRPTLATQGFFRPVPGSITSLFGWRPQFGRMHHGVDLRLNIGDTVRTAVSGTVSKIAYDHDGYGHYVVVDNADGMETLYGHLQYALVSQGQVLLAGDPVGIGGNTGNSTGPHLHFEARLDGIAIDPTLLFDFYGRSYVYSEREHIDPEESPAASKKPLRGKHTYVVKYGDTPKSVARRAGISLSKLCRLNMIKSTDKLDVGRMIKLK